MITDSDWGNLASMSAKQFRGVGFHNEGGDDYSTLLYARF